MARRHFNAEGFPKLDAIVREICGYVGGLEVEYTALPPRGNVIDPSNTPHGERVVSEGVDFIEGIPPTPFKAKGIYVVGGQASYLPRSYHRGNHDLDMVVTTNAREVAFTPDVERDVDVERDIWHELCSILNDGRRETKVGKEFFLDLFCEGGEQIEKPYYKLYPPRA